MLRIAWLVNCLFGNRSIRAFEGEPSTLMLVVFSSFHARMNGDTSQKFAEIIDGYGESKPFCVNKFSGFIKSSDFFQIRFKFFVLLTDPIGCIPVDITPLVR